MAHEGARGFEVAKFIFPLLCIVLDEMWIIFHFIHRLSSLLIGLKSTCLSIYVFTKYGLLSSLDLFDKNFLLHNQDLLLSFGDRINYIAEFIVQWNIVDRIIF